jgi:hypothetical protein
MYNSFTINPSPGGRAVAYVATRVYSVHSVYTVLERCARTFTSFVT